MKKNQTYLLIAAAALVVGISVYLLFFRKKDEEQDGNTNEQQQQQQSTPNVLTDKVNKATPAPAPPKPQGATQQQWNDPTYVMASRINDSLDMWKSASQRTAAWKELAGKSNDFIKHTNNWFNGHFGKGKSMRQLIEETLWGDTNVILPRMASLGL